MPVGGAFGRYSEYMLSDEWEKTRQKALRVHGRWCFVCGRTGNLQVHHKTYERFLNERMDDLMVLCKRCHGLVHSKLKDDKETLAAMLKGRQL